MAEDGNVSTPAPTDISGATRITLYTVLLVWSLVGNVLVIIVVFCNKNLRSTFNQLVLNMAVSDLVIPLLSLPIKIAEEALKPPDYKWLVGGSLGTILCKLCFFLADLSPAVSVFSLLIIAVERFILTVYPVSRFKFTARLNYFLIGGTWFTSMALTSPYLYTFRTITINGHTFCYSSWSPAFDDSVQKIYVLVICVVAFVVPFISIIVLYSLMLYKLNQNDKTVRKSMLHHQKGSSQRKRRNKTVFYISVSICVAFALLWGPYFSLIFVHYFILTKPIKEPLVSFVINYLAFANSAINPCIYFIFLKSFRKGFENIFKRKQNGRPSTRNDRVQETLL